MPPTTVRWSLDAHSVGKHLVLESYLKAWIPIMGLSGRRIVFIDGFAGPGTYETGERGSPLIALETARDHPMISRLYQVVMLFIEPDSRRSSALEQEVASRSPLPKEIQVQVANLSFTDAIEQLRSVMEENNATLAPSFTMVDPFGISDVRHEDLRWLLAHSGAEVFVSFMGSHARRFVTHPNFERGLTSFFGHSDWKNLQGRSHAEILYGFNKMFDASLRAAGANFVVRFDLYSGNSYKYSIFFGSKHPTGCDKIKQAIWKAMPDGSYSYIGQSGAQFLMSMRGVSMEELDKTLLGKIANDEWTKVSDLQEFLKTDQTLFHSGHLAKALQRLEKSGAIIVDTDSRKKRGSHPPETCRVKQAPAR